jgi:hypothetical protein
VAFTLWHVADRASTDLMRLFYQGLRHRLSLDRALRTAKLSFLDHADAVRAHPFYWAGYIVVGRTESVALFRSNIWIIIIASILFALLITGFLIRKNTT